MYVDVAAITGCVAIVEVVAADAIGFAMRAATAVRVPAAIVAEVPLLPGVPPSPPLLRVPPPAHPPLSIYASALANRH